MEVAKCNDDKHGQQNQWFEVNGQKNQENEDVENIVSCN